MFYPIIINKLIVQYLINFQQNLIALNSINYFVMKSFAYFWQLLLIGFLLLFGRAIFVYAEESHTLLEDDSRVYTKNEQLNIAINPNETLAFRVIFNHFIHHGKVAIKETVFNAYASNPLPQDIDVIALNRTSLRSFCDEKMLTTINWEYIPHKNLLNQTAYETCGVGYRVQGTVLAYSNLHYYGTPPHQWHDFFDINKYPGLRALPKHSHHLLEIALLAKGYPIKEVYDILKNSEGQQEALNKLNEISEHLLWWDTITQAQEWLNNGRVSMAIVPAGAIQSPLNQEKNFSITYYNMIYGMEYLAIPKSSTKEELALSFIAYATRPEQQLQFSKVSPSGMTLKTGWTLLTEPLIATLTNSPQNLINAIPENHLFYQNHGDRLEKAFQAWREDSSLHIHTIEISSFDEQVNNENKREQDGGEEEEEILEIQTIMVTPKHE